MSPGTTEETDKRERQGTCCEAARHVTAVASVVIPAHNEERVIGRNLTLLHEGWEPGSLDVVVVCNGCTDATATAASLVSPDIRVIEIPEPSKEAAVRVGNLATDVFPRVHLDADVELSGADLRGLLEPLSEGVLATAPRRVVPRDRASWLVRSYYEVWEKLPQVRSGLFGRGVIALSEEGQQRVSAMPKIMSDDLGLSEAFSPAERRIVEDAAVVVHPPRTARDLLRRRIRIATGNAQASELGIRQASSVTAPSVLARMALGDPALALRLPVFVGFGVAARWASHRAVRSGDFTTWLRDESSRA